MRLSHESISECLGPGRRYILWTQGCHRRCPGCINPQGQLFEGGYEKTVEELLKKIFSVENICGVTISGGEPMLQYDAIRELVKGIKVLSKLDVMVYSGYQIEELRMLYRGIDEDFFSLVDIFIDGEYKEELNHDAMYRGSDNQHMYFFTEKYRRYREKILDSKNRDFMFEIRDDGEVFLVGIPPVGFYRRFLEQLSEFD